MNQELSDDAGIPLAGILTPEEIARLPIRKYEGPVQLVASERELERAAPAILREKVVGLDTETRPAFVKGQSYLPSLVQVAASSAVYLFPLRNPGLFGALSGILESAEVVKAGIGLADDLKGLKKIFPFEPRNTLDLSAVARAEGFQQSGVRALAARLLGFRVTKGLATSNWAKSHLSSKQIAYAATDAWVCREIYLSFQRLGFLDAEGRPTKTLNGNQPA